MAPLLIRRFLHWATTVPAEARAEGASALARAFVDGQFAAGEEAEAEAALTALLDDPAPLVRRALARVLAASARTPSPIVTALLADSPDIAALVLEFSPVLTTSELVDAVAVGDAVAQCAVARRAGLDVGLAAAIAEVGGVEACIELCRNETAVLAQAMLSRMVERLGDDADLRGIIASRGDLSPAIRSDLVAETARSLAAFVTAQGWLSPDRATRITQDATEQACVSIAATTGQEGGGTGLVSLVRHWRLAGCLTPALMLRAVLCGNLALFEAAISDLSGVPLKRVAGLIQTGHGLGFHSLYRKAGLPLSLRPAFAAALEQAEASADPSGATLQRGRIGRVLAVCRGPQMVELGTIAALLRRLDAQAAREEARVYAGDVLREAPLLRLQRLATVDRHLPLPSAA